MKIQNQENPRVEKEEHYYNPAYQGLLELGVKPNYLTEESMKRMFRLVSKYKDQISRDVIFRGVKW